MCFYLWPDFPVLTSGRKGGASLHSCSSYRNANCDNEHLCYTLTVYTAALGLKLQLCELEERCFKVGDAVVCICLGDCNK